ncbi:translation initiation factor IF-2 [Ruminiclostridium hungatei]|uniref:Translation initiation factor IF-2 n=1 Tax=Ruminiclostridium hungatei TaxID=48256 RepID=A0A1V4SQR8_RUMHU|nr:translation initiation factor IF-2 [Ruminiclostridium hungatei]OPX46222.1 translation initiation factor IF-2 [Ruminiclostridium hungatei]
MDKARIYELAKELNTTSKRLMEKLAEININVKNHMSLLEPHELDALYKHIGVIKHDDKKDEDKRAGSADTSHSADKKKDVKKDMKSAPRIIRTTEIVIDSKGEAGSTEHGGYVKKETNQGHAKPSYVKTESSTSGLRPGYVRDNIHDMKNKPVARTDRSSELQKNPIKTSVAQHDDSSASRQNVKPEVIKKEENIVADKTIQTDVSISKNINSNDTANKENLAERVDMKPNAVTEPKEAVAAKDAAPASRNESMGNKVEEVIRPEAKASEETPGKIQGEKPQGDRPQGDRPQGQYNRPQGDRPQGQYNRPQGDRPQGQYNRPQGDRPQGQYNRPQGDRPQGQYNRPQGDRPQGQYNRPQGDRPQGQYNRPQGDRPQGQYNRPQGDRPQGQYNRPQGDRPQGQYNRPQGDRPQGQYNRPQGDRPQGQYNRGDRPQGQYNRPQGDRPQGQYNRPQGDRPQGQYNRGDRPQGQYNRPQGDRPQGQYNNRQQGLDIPKPDVSVAQDQFDSLRNEARREFQSKDIDKNVKREEKQKKESPKTTTDKKQRFKPQKIVIEKKGVSEILDENYIFDEFYSDDGKKKRLPRNRKNEKLQEKYIPPKAVLTSITIPESLTVKELAESLKKTSTEIIKKLMNYGVMATLNNEVDFETATIIAEEFGVKTEKAVQVSEEDILFDDAETVDESKLQTRPPVVVVMGHVDHGKTSLLDAIRSAHVIDSEAGGITQHIGAYTVKANDKLITFLDTPGHEAFTAMRARGAQVTDIAILVVAADDGVMPQTIEAINHAKAANVSIIVAINKIDKPGANPDKVKQELTEYGIVAEEWGGDAIMVPVSAKKRENIDQLLEMVLLAADMLELKADPDRQAKGTIIEAKLDKERGPVATVLVQRGTLKIGDSMLAGSAFGRIKAMNSDKGVSIKSAGPSMPVEILGMNEVPEAGEVFYAVTDEKVAKQLVEKRKFRLKEQQYKSSAKVTLEDLFTQIKEGKVKDLNIIIKADVQGSVEAVKQSLEKLSNDEVRVRTIHGAVGAITESDVTLAQVSSAIIIGFNVRPGANVTEAAKNAEVDMRLYSVIYKAIEDVQAAMKGMLEPTYKEVVLGHIEIRQIFKVSGIGTIGGAYVTDGKVQRNSEVRVVREGIVIHEGKLASLKRFKDDVKEVVAGYECGVSVERFNDIKELDVIEAFVMEEVKR